MSIPAKSSVLRAILSDDSLVKMASSLGETGKMESKTIQLSSGQMTTEQLVNRIKDLTRLRDEIQQTMRQLNVARDASPSTVDQMDYDREYELVEQELEEARRNSLELYGRIERIQNQINDSKKRIAALNEISQTGFGTDELESESQEFRKILGRLPIKKLQVVQKAVMAQFKDQVIFVAGTKKRDSIYVLVAIPRDKASQVLQLLLPHDFTSVEIPEYKSQNISSEIQAEEERARNLTEELEAIRPQLDELRTRTGQILNRRLDEVIEALMLLRAILKLGEGIEASRVYTHLQSSPSTETIKSLSKRGIIELEASS
ncbi:MAG TPA: hypothetical protein VFE96_05080 [Candidatus Bathyarchaeia archaeon]|jgi:uncharacterized protein (DUF3084 family)|nr:hypothetical protein [Candidatus Bathyarchaeia archaeon]